MAIKLAKFALFGFLLPAILSVHSGCAGVPSSGSIESPVLSDDGKVVAFFDQNYPDVYVADGQGVHRVGSANRFALSSSGRYVLAINASQFCLQVGDTLTLYEVPTGRSWTTQLPDLGKDAKNPKKRDWPETDTYGFAVAIEDTPAVLFRLPTSSSAYSYTKWQPGEAWKTIERPTARLPADFKTHASYGDLEDLPFVEFGSDVFAPRRTVWVRPDASTVELLRKNDEPNRLAHWLLMMPSVFWAPMPWLCLDLDMDGRPLNKLADPKARLAELVVQRKAAATQPTPTTVPAAPRVDRSLGIPRDF